MKWHWYHDLSTHALYQIHHHGGITKYDELPHLHRRNRYYYTPFGEHVDHLPLTACPTLPVWSNNAHCCTEGYPLPRQPDQIQSQTFHGMLDMMDNEIRQWLEYSFVQDDGLQSIITLIENNQAIMVVDGSFLPDSGVAAASWVIAGHTGETLAVGYSRLPDGNISNDPYRAELFGLCLALSFLQVINKYKPDLRGSIVISCDNDEALRQGIIHEMWPKSTSSHFDLIAIIHRFRLALPFILLPRQVMGHQDELGRPLTRLEELNVIADDAARTMAYQIERQQHIQLNMTLLSQQWRVSLDGKILKKDLRQAIRTSVLGNQIIEHWISKRRFHRNQIHRIDWEALHQSAKRKPMHHRIWATKFLSGFCGSYHKLHQIGTQPSPLCPRCNLFDETTSHILFCQHITSAQSRTTALRDLERWFDNTQTRWDVKETIISALTDLQPTTTLAAYVPFNPYDDTIFTAARSQDGIGMQNFLEGFISKEWKTIMMHYYREIKSKRSASSWATGLHIQMQQFARAQWDHRNSVVHARNAKGRKLTSEKEIKTRLEYQLNLGVRYLPVHLHHLANFNLEEALSQPRSKMLSWLHHLEVVRPFYEEMETRDVNTQRIFFRHWLRI